jgi:hypothetical protein
VDGQLWSTEELGGGSLPEKLRVAWCVDAADSRGSPTDGELRRRGRAVVQGGSERDRRWFKPKEKNGGSGGV